ncbi:MAG: VOC family protein [Planctomycetes bacterium]|nr:VOC family protein [Planctomycetota bacterium]
MSRVVHFEIHAEDPERALAFYQGVVGWQFQKWAGPMDYWLIVTGPDSEKGINGGMIRRMGPAPSEGQAVNAYACTIQVAALDETVAKATAAGAVIALPKMPIPGIGWLAYIKDTEGNIVGVMQPDPQAK